MEVIYNLKKSFLIFATLARKFFFFLGHYVHFIYFFSFSTDMQIFRGGYKELLLSGRNSDFTINVKSMKFEVHRSILAARSPVFSAMMEHEMEEKRSGEMTIIDADPAVFKEFLLYLYTGDEEDLDWKNIADLYTLGDKYFVQDLKHLCVERIKTHISIENFFQIFYISQQLNNLNISESVIQFFLEDAKEIVASEKCIEFVKTHREESNVLLEALEANIKAQ